MDVLPTEIHLEILSYLSSPDYINYRLISTRCADVAASLVFATFKYNATVHDFNRIAVIVIPDLAQHVKTLQYDDENGRAGRKYGYTNAFNIRLVDVLESLVKAGAQLSGLTAQSLPYWFFAPGSFGLDPFAQICAGLTHLTLDIRWYVSERYNFSDVLRSGNLCAMLQGMQCLEALVLRFGPETKEDNGSVGGYLGMTMYSGPRPRVSDVLPPQMVCGTLQKLELWFVSATVTELVDLLKRCAPTVRELDLAGVALCEEDGRRMMEVGERKSKLWRKVVKELESCEELRRVCLRERTRNTALDEWQWCVEGPIGNVMLETDLYRYLADGNVR